MWLYMQVGHMIVLLIFHKTFIIFSLIYTNFYLHIQCTKMTFFSVYLLALLILGFFDNSHSLLECGVNALWFYYTLLLNGIKHFTTHLLAIVHIQKCLLRYYCQFLKSYYFVYLCNRESEREMHESVGVLESQ